MDGLEPDCETCGFRDITEENDRALAVYDLACPWGDLDYQGLTMAFAYFQIRPKEQRKYCTKIVTIHRMIRKHHDEQE